MNLLMTVGVKEHPVLQLARTTIHLPVNMVDTPTCFSGDAFAANRTHPLLLAPLMVQPGTVLKVLKYFVVLSLLEVDLPGRIIRIRVGSHLDMPADWEKSRALAAASNGRIRPLQMDVTRAHQTPELLDGGAIVVICLDKFFLIRIR